MKLSPWRSAIVLASLVMVGGMSGEGCPSRDFSELAGEWAITRGDVHVTFTYTIDNGGEVEQDSSTHELEPLDPNDFPDQLADLITQWNNGLDDFNAALDEAMPDAVFISFPGVGQMRIVNADDASKSADGLINDQAAYVFVGDVSGAGEGDDQGNGAILDVAAINGSFEVEAQTTSGQVSRTLAVFLSGANNNSLSFSASIQVDYTGVRVGDLPDNDNDNSNENENDNSSGIPPGVRA